MDKQIRHMYNEIILEKILSFWDLDKGKIEELDGFESFIYKTAYKGKPAVLKISHTHRRSIDDLKGEIDFTSYLAAKGLNVPQILSNRNNQSICRADAEKGSFTGVLYSYLEGSPADKKDWKSGLPEKMGQLLGKMHYLSKSYQAEEGKRPTLFDEFAPLFDKYLDDGDILIKEKVQSHYEKLRSFSQTEENWGLIHVDFHRGNFYIHNGEINLFDFDDCQYSWFTHDIAMALFYVLPVHQLTGEDIENGHRFLSQLLTGYNRENKLTAEELQKIPDFLKLREMELYTVIKRSFDLNNLDPWCEAFMKGRKDKLEQEVPYFPLDLSSYTD